MGNSWIDDLRVDVLKLSRVWKESDLVGLLMVLMHLRGLGMESLIAGATSVKITTKYGKVCSRMTKRKRVERWKRSGPEFDEQSRNRERISMHLPRQGSRALEGDKFGN